MKFKKIVSALFLILIMSSLVFSVGVSAEVKYAKIPKFYQYTEAQVIELLNAAGVKYKITYQENENEKGIVFKFVYYGYSDKDNYYVNTASEVTLYVSGTPVTTPPVTFTNSTQADSSKMIYLTFDDGPHKDRTAVVLDILKKYDIKATFFLVGQYIDAYPELVRRIYSEGHAIACHTYDHKFTYVYSSVEAFEWEIKQWEASVKKVLGKDLDYKIFRYPGGSNNSYLAKALAPDILAKVRELGYTPYDWTMANNDAWTVQKKSYQTMDDFLKWSISSTLTSREKTPAVPKIVLMHDTNQYTIDMVEWTIQYLIEQGYTFGTLNQLSGDGWLF